MSDPRYYLTDDPPTPEEEAEAAEWMQRDTEEYECPECKDRWLVEGWFPPDRRFPYDEPSVRLTDEFADVFCPVDGEDVYCYECEVEGSR